MPIEKIKDWIEEEKKSGSKEADSVVLATASPNGEVHSRIVAIRGLDDSGILFFTQKRSRKAKELRENPLASMTLWLPLHQREVILDGMVVSLSKNENEHYWGTLPRERQLRFLTYRSGEPIDSLEGLQNRYNALESQYQNQKIPMGDSYCGYRLVPKRMYFYTLGQNTFSEVVQYVLHEKKWVKQLISP